MMTYITEIAFYDSIFSATLELAKVSNTLLKTIKNRVRLVENELKTWEIVSQNDFEYHQILNNFIKGFYACDAETFFKFRREQGSSFHHML